ncbi:tetratricopeptide repeat protein, partial [Allochromatium humboldtianum]
RLKTGALTDFDLFMDQGWQVEACRTERAWFEAAARHALLENHWTREQHRLSDEAWTQGTALRQAERFLEAAEAYRRSAEVEQASGRPRMQDLTAKLSLAALMYQRIARYGEAEPLFREALAIRQQALPEGHPDIATSLNSLAELLLATGRYGEAEPLLREALAICRQVLLEGHPDIALTLNNLALLLETTGRYDEAEPLYREALAIRQQALPAGHPAIAGSLNNLAELLKTTGRPAEAEPLYQQALQIAQSLQVPELLWTVQGNLADFYAKHSQRPRAILFGKQAVNTLQAVRQNLVGTEQAIQQSFLKNKECYYKHLADWLIAEGCLREAQQVLEILKAQEHFEFIRGDLCHTQSTQDRSDSTGEVCHAGA